MRAASTALIVLGMHRSGTSALARALNLLGVDLGSRLMGAHPTRNPRGHWEHLDLVECHERLLDLLGSSWSDTRDLPERWWESPPAREVAEAVRAVLEREFGSTPLWGFKDPRACRLLPFWHQRLREFGATARFVLIARHPLEVCASLERRDGLTRDHALQLWLQHVLASTRDTRGHPRVVVTFDALVRDPAGVLAHVGDALGLRWPAAPTEPLRDVVDSSLRHHTHGAATDIGHASLPRFVGLVWEALLHAAQHGTAAADRDLNCLEGAFDESLRLFACSAAEAADRARAAERALAEAQLRQAEASARAADAERRLAESEAHMAAWAASVRRGVDALLDSRSWRVGDGVASLWRTVSGRGPSDSPQAHLRRALAAPPHVVAPRRAQAAPDPDVLEHALKDFLSDSGATLEFPTCPDPWVSVIIPTYGKAAYLLACLQAVRRTVDPGRIPYEVVVVDDASPDPETPALLARVRHVRILRNATNQEFVRSCNAGAAAARAPRLLLLNNDVVPLAGWLDALLATLDRWPRCGAVGAKLVLPDGRLQEAGSIIWPDGTATGYGRGGDPDASAYDYVREVDYCSAACLLIPRDAWMRLGGLDERYCPAYYEDADLCLGVRSLGRVVCYQPAARVVHYEFTSRSDARAQALCQANLPRFAAKWAARLPVSHGPAGDLLRARDRRPGPRVLMIEDELPDPRLGSGLPRAHALVHMVTELGGLVTFVPGADPTPHRRVMAELQQAGIETFHGAGLDVSTLLAERKGFYDLAIVSRPHNAAQFAESVRRHNPRARIFYDAEALFCERQIRQSAIEGRALPPAEQERLRAAETRVMQPMDGVIAVCEPEADLIRRHLPGGPPVFVWGFPCPVRPPQRGFAERSGVAYVGGFLRGHPPNADAIRHFVRDIWPSVRERLPGVTLTIVGTRADEVVGDLAGPGITVRGGVPDLSVVYEQVRVVVNPLRFGAGVNLKFLEALSFGVPCVVSPLVAEGVGAGLVDTREVSIAAEPVAFAERVAGLYADADRWSAMSGAALAWSRAHTAPDRMRRELARILGLAPATDAPPGAA